MTVKFVVLIDFGIVKGGHKLKKGNIYSINTSSKPKAWNEARIRKYAEYGYVKIVEDGEAEPSKDDIAVWVAETDATREAHFKAMWPDGDDEDE